MRRVIGSLMRSVNRLEREADVVIAVKNEKQLKQKKKKLCAVKNSPARSYKKKECDTMVIKAAKRFLITTSYISFLG